MGRVSEIEVLERLVADVAAGRGGVVLAVGEQGAGKTALLTQGLRETAAGAGCRVAWGSGDELDEQFPLRLMVKCLEGDGIQVPPGPVAGPGGGATGVERVLTLVERWCSAGPVVVVAEDLQWADEASLLAWGRLTQRAARLPLLVAGSCRPGSKRADRLSRFVTVRGGLVMELGPLPDSEVAVLASRWLGGHPGERLSAVLAQAGGNPAYVRELVDALMHTGRIAVTGRVAELAGDAAQVPVPASLRAVVAERLASLDTTAADVLRWAAVLGAEFVPADLQVVSGLDASESASALQAAVTAGVLVDSAPWMRFRPGLIRQVLYDALPQAVTAALHGQAARALAESGAPAERVAAQLVAAPDETGDWAASWLAHVAPVLAFRAPAVAAQLLRRVLAAMPPADSHREVLEAALVTAAFLLTEQEEVERVARPLLASTTDPDRAAETAWLLAYTLSRTGRGEEAAVVAEQSLARPGTAVVRAADYYFEVGSWDDALAVLAAAQAHAGHDLPVHAQAALIALHRDDRETLAHHLAAVRDQVFGGHFRYYQLWLQALDAEREGRPEEVVAVLTPCLDPADDMPCRCQLLPMLARAALAAGDGPAAAAAAVVAAHEADREPLPVDVAAARWCRGLAGGDPGLVLEAAACYESAGRPVGRALALEDAAVLLAGVGRRAEAWQAFSTAAGLYLELGAAWDLRRADVRLHLFGIRRGRRARPRSGWEALTPTEATVARLVAEGRSNPDIAAELFLSRNTVQTHVSHILAKLGARSRAEVIRQAFQQQGGE
ncbi:MAG TPA: LuxR C-terminal-related transcriptional regulator [Streptosporangiaceae bacterium]|nr:LuxR C-terminal-related transcriptional regulator [Streptosporangiaceae bacterium]